MWKPVVSASTDLKTEIFGRCGVGIAAEILVDDVLIFAGTGLEEDVSSQFVWEYIALTSAALEQSCLWQGHRIWLSASAKEIRGRMK